MLPAVSLYTRAVRTTGIDAWTRVLPKLNFSKLFLKLPCKTGSSSRPEETQIPNQNLHVPAPSLSLSPKSPRIQARTGPNQYSPPWVRYFCLGRGPVLDAAPQGSFCEGAGPPAGGNDTFAPKTVGFVGLGNMGSPMAANLLKAGHNLVVHDRNGDAMRALKDKGATSAPSPAELANEVDVVITMLPSAPHVLDVYLGASGLLKERDHIRPTLFIDASTVDPAMCRAVAAAASRCTLASASSPWEGATTSDGPYVVDAPVSGGVPGAQAATLTFMEELGAPLLAKLGRAKAKRIQEMMVSKWNNQLHSPLHSVARLLNPKWQDTDMRGDKDATTGFAAVLQKRVGTPRERIELQTQLRQFREGTTGVFILDGAIEAREAVKAGHMSPADWWYTWDSETPELQSLAIQILSQPSSASCCERNWSTHDQIHTKRRSRLSSKKIEDLVYFNLKIMYSYFREGLRGGKTNKAESMESATLEELPDGYDGGDWDDEEAEAIVVGVQPREHEWMENEEDELE